MLKLNASYSKKVPAEGEYSSQSYHASIEVELPDGLTQDQLNSKIHETFALVRDSVESELHGGNAVQPASVQQEPSRSNPQGYQPARNQAASSSACGSSPVSGYASISPITFPVSRRVMAK